MDKPVIFNKLIFFVNAHWIFSFCWVITSYVYLVNVLIPLLKFEFFGIIFLSFLRQTNISNLELYATLLRNLFIILPLLISVAYLTLFERKLLAAMQRRRGPSLVGILGTLQPFADGLKLFTKEIFLPAKSNKLLFVFSPILFLSLGLILWVFLPFNLNSFIVDSNLNILYILATSSLSVYGLILGGWSSNSQYAFLGAIRSAAQMISYEIAMALLILTVVVCAQSLNLYDISLAQQHVWFVFLLFPVYIMFFISILAETSRPPFDLPEAEAELVSGYNIEYASMGFAFYFIGEYSNIIYMSFLCTALFLGGWGPTTIPFSALTISLYNVKSLILTIKFVWVRGSFPRYRYDQLMFLTWSVFLPVSLALFVFVLAIKRLL